MDLRNQHVQFRISDIYIPNPHLLIWQLHCDDLLRGKVIDLSDSGSQQAAYAVIEVEGMEQPMIVPVDCLLGVPE